MEADLSQASKQWIIDTLRLGFAGGTDKPVRGWAIQLDQTKATTAALQTDVDALQSEVARLHEKLDALGSGAGGSLTRTDVEEVVRAIFGDAATPPVG